MSAVVARILQSRLAGNALSLYAVQGLNYLMPLLLLPFLLRVLTPQGYGSIMLAQSLCGYAGIVTDFGFNLTAARDISVARGDPQQLARIYWTTLAAKLLLLLLSVLVLAAVVALTPAFRGEWPVFAASGLLVLGNAVFPQWYFQGMERLKEVALAQALAKCLVTGAALVLVRTAQDVVLAAAILASPQLVGAVAAWCTGRGIVPATFHRPTLVEVWLSLRGSWHMFASNVWISLYSYTNTLVLGLICGEREVAWYSLGARITGFVNGLSTPVTQAVFPRASLLFAGPREQAWTLLRRVTLLLLPALALVALALGLFAPLVVRLLAGPDYAGAVPVLRILAVMPLLLTSSTLLAQTVMVNIGLTAQLWRIYALVGLLNLPLLFLLVQRYAAAGAAWSLVFAEALGPLLMLRAVWPHRHGVAQDAAS